QSLVVVLERFGVSRTPRIHDSQAGSSRCEPGIRCDRVLEARRCLLDFVEILPSKAEIGEQRRTQVRPNGRAVQRPQIKLRRCMIIAPGERVVGVRRQMGHVVVIAVQPDVLSDFAKRATNDFTTTHERTKTAASRPFSNLWW